MGRRTPSFLLIGSGVVLLLVWYVAYTQQVVNELRRAAEVQGRMSSRIYSALADTSTAEGARIDALLSLAQQVRASGVPLILTAPDGQIADTANLPFAASFNSDTMRRYLAQLDAKRAPLEAPGAGAVHVGDSDLVRGLTTIPLVQAGAIALLVLIGVWGVRERGRAEREKVWAGMARESAHQLGTPLSSLAGWVELLGDRAASAPDADATTQRALTMMQQDITRLDRVANRFERIGRPPRRDPIDLGALADRMAAYFADRVPQLQHRVTVTAQHPETPLSVRGDEVLLEWVAEVLVKNAIDALGGRGGAITIAALPVAEGGGILRVQDDGPGVPRHMRKRIFDAGYSTKERGWGIGLALARRIVEENHRGTLQLVDTTRGATFDVRLPA